jgi:hypothetical protein
VIGRPYLVEGAALTAALRVGDEGWAAAGMRVDELDADDRLVLADVWARDALFEHASIASFARFALELMAVGAPSSLLADAQRAALDETRHAEMCFALASRYAGAALGPDVFPLERDRAARRTLVEVAVATAAEGCIGETIAAAMAQAQLERATDPEVRHVLATIAEDEARHAELAWRTLAWALAQGGDEVHDALARVFADAAQHVPDAGQLPDDRLAAHGRLGAPGHKQLQRRVLEDVVLPCARALLDQHATRVASGRFPAVVVG